MKTVIHIGQHKTATSSIQYFLKERRDDFSKHGVCIPSKIYGYETNSDFILSVYALDVDRWSPMKEKMQAVLGTDFHREIERDVKHHIEGTYSKARDDGASCVLWSNEGLYLLNSIEEYRRLRELFSPYSNQIDVICCFRDRQSFACSYKNQLTKNHKDFVSDPDSYRYVGSDSWLFDYGRKSRMLEAVFDTCIFFKYDQEENISRFLAELGLDFIESSQYRLNQRESMLGKLKRQVRKRFARHFSPAK